MRARCHSYWHRDLCDTKGKMGQTASRCFCWWTGVHECAPVYFYIQSLCQTHTYMYMFIRHIPGCLRHQIHHYLKSKTIKCPSKPLITTLCPGDGGFIQGAWHCLRGTVPCYWCPLCIYCAAIVATLRELEENKGTSAAECPRWFRMHLASPQTWDIINC